MYSRTDVSQLFLTNKIGLQKVFKTLITSNTDGVTYDDIDDADFETSLNAQYLKTLTRSFEEFDDNDDDKISQKEFNTMMKVLSIQGYTSDQLQTLSNRVGISQTQKELLNEVIANLNSVDTNHDGRVSETEINTYMVNKEISEGQKDLEEDLSDQFSIFYSDSSSDSDDDSDIDA